MGDEASLLYHYTSAEGLLAILSSRTVWATDILYLNDSAEFSYAVGLLNSILKEQFNLSELSSPFTMMLEWWPQINSFPSVYVMAFSAEADQLGQWRGYCPPTGGFSIGFDKERLRTYAKSRGFELERCIYTSKEHTELLSGLAKEIYEVLGGRSFLAALEENREEVLSKYGDLHRQLTKLAPRIK